MLRWSIEDQERTEVHHQPSKRRFLRDKIARSDIGAVNAHRDGGYFPVNLLFIGAHKVGIALYSKSLILKPGTRNRVVYYNFIYPII